MSGESEDWEEDVVVATIEPRYSKDATHILERWEDFQYIEVGRAHSEEEARSKAQYLADFKEISIRIRLRNQYDD